MNAVSPETKIKKRAEILNEYILREFRAEGPFVPERGTWRAPKHEGQ